MKCKYCEASKLHEYAESYETDWTCLLGVQEDDLIEFNDGETGCNRKGVRKIKRDLKRLSGGIAVITKVRKRVLIGDTEKVKTLYRCLCKWGTHECVYTHLFNKPNVGVFTKAIKNENNITYGEQFDVRIYEIREGIVYLEMA